MSLFLIAEIGINHNGDIEIAKKLISHAKKAGFDAVKFQKRTVEKVYTKDFLDSPRESPWGNTQRHQKNGIEFDFKEYQKIDDYCKSLNILWSASAWDVDSQIFLRKFDLKFNKIASPMMGNFPLIKEVASEKKKTFISTGMCTLEEIDKVVDMFRMEGCEFELMHCVSTYPMEEKDANLKTIETLKKRYKCNVGYSGHESSLLKIGIIATTLGATSIERHITLDRAMYGSDQAASISCDVLKNFVSSVRAVKEILGSGEKKVLDKEKPIRAKLRIDRQ